MSCLLQEEAQEESGWKQVHGDVFRPPKMGMLLSVFLGQGCQIFIMTFITLCKCIWNRNELKVLQIFVLYKLTLRVAFLDL